MNTDSSQWRLISHPAHGGAWNMATDEAILHAVADGVSPPTLRLYAWDPACLSLGRAQPISDVDQAQLEEEGWDLVRRPTGGRAILHHAELTYAVIAPEAHPLMQGGVLESYRRISQALVSALQQLTVLVEVKGSEATSEADRINPVCFEVPSAYEITVQGRKVLGSAQVRRRKTVLQHGSLPLSGNIDRICDVLQYQNEAQRELARRQVQHKAATLEDLLGRAVPWQQAAEVFLHGFETELGLSLHEGELTQWEESFIETLLKDRYCNPEWTERVADRPPQEQTSS
jgi:lipoate-protein ligase A